MLMRNYPAFGYVMCRTSLLAGEIVNDDLMKNNIMPVKAVASESSHNKAGAEGFDYVVMILNGVHTFRNVATNEVYNFSRGYCSLDSGLPVGDYEFTVSESSDFLCFSGFVNKKSLPPMEVFRLSAGETTVLPTGTKLYFAEGILEVGNRIVTSMKQLRISDTPPTLSAVTDCYGLIFKD